MVLFRCDWIDNRVEDKWVKTDQFGVTIVNLNHLFSSGDKLSDEPFISASQATQVYYVPEANDKGWCAVVQNKKPQDTYSMAAMDDENTEDGLDNEGLLVDLNTGVDPNIDYANFSHIRTDIDGIIVAAPKKRQEQKWQQQQETQKTSLSEEREVRKITTMKSIWGRQNKPKLKLEVNEIGQPCGNSATRFANFIGTQIRTKGFPLAFDDWRKVDLPLKLGLWTQAKLFWDIDQGSFEWYMKTAQTKWREFKADLKKDWYDESMEYHELISSCDDRVHPDQWKWLVDHWLTPEAKARSIRGKANRAKHTQNHTAGSKSFARVDTEMTEELKRRPRRDEMLIRTHTHKSGVPQKGSASTIEKLQTEAKKHPELLEKSIKDGDLFSHVCGKEKSGYVRVVGLGPTPSDLEFPGTRKYKSTKLQMETEARRVADRRAEYMQQEMDELRQQMVEMKQMFLSSQGQQEENNNAHRHGSHTQQNTRTPEDFNEGANNSGNHILEDEAESNASMQVVNRNEDHPGRRIANVEKQPNRQHGGGRDVVVYSMARPFNVPVAKGTIQTTDPKAMVGGEPLGDQYVEIVIHSVFKRGTLLPRPYGDVVTMGDACGKSIAWPAAMMKDNKTRTTVLAIIELQLSVMKEIVKQSKHLEHLSLIGLPNQKAINNMHYEKFHEWFREHVLALVERGVQVSEEIQILAQEPFRIGRKYNSYTAKGFHFHTHSSDEGRPTQNSGVALAAESAGVIKMYYGIIREIVGLDYQHKENMVLFRCDWIDNRVEDKWVKTDQFGVTIVNLNHLFSSGDKLSDEPFISASQATQVYYVPEANDKGWCAVVQNKKPQDTYSMAAMDDENTEDGLDNEGLLVDLNTGVDPNIDYANFSHIRTDIDGIIVAAPKKRQEQKWQQQQETQKTSLSEEREVRKITTMKSIWGRQNKPKLKLEVNEIGQPCGNSATRFANFIGTQIRTKGFPLAFDDWRKVDLPLKLGLWTQAKLFWDIDQGSFEWYMKTAQTKWREFKADLKKDWYDESMEYHELISSCDDRVHPDQWKWLVDHWLTPEAKEKLQTEAKKHPELLEKSIKDGDLFSHVCGKEKSGYVRVVGLGPTPSDLEFPGTRKYKSTKLQMETEARRVADRRAEYMQQEMDELRQQMVEMKQMFLSSQGQQEENNNAHRHGSHTQQNTRTPEDFNEGANNSGNHILEDEAESNASMQVVNRNEDHPGRRIANVEKQPNRQHGGGRDVVVYSMARPFNVPVAKGTIQTTDPKAMVGDER
ncbi:hypothetical protein ACQ4PT_022407 [Festuca glaucescens]